MGAGGLWGDDDLRLGVYGIGGVGKWGGDLKLGGGDGKDRGVGCLGRWGLGGEGRRGEDLKLGAGGLGGGRT